MLIKTIHHDALPGFEANEHIDHTTVSISAGGILSGGGTIAANRTISLANGDIDHDQLLNFAANEHYLQSAIVATGALNSGSITSGFGSIDVGASDITTTGSGRFGEVTSGGNILAGGEISMDGAVLTIGRNSNNPLIVRFDHFGGIGEIQWSGSQFNFNNSLVVAGRITADDVTISGTLDVSGISRLDGGVGIGIDPTTTFPFNALAGVAGQYAMQIDNTDTGEDGLAQAVVMSTVGNLSIIAHSPGRIISRYGVTLGGTGELLSVGMPLSIGTVGNNDIVLGTNSNLAMTINGANQNITIAQALSVTGSMFANGSLTVANNLNVGGISNLGNDTGDVILINDVYTLPQVKGTSEFLVKQSGGTAWEYTTSIPTSGDWGFWTRAGTTITTKTANDSLTIGASGTIQGGTLTDGTATLTGGNLTDIGIIGASGDADLLTLSADQLTVAGNLTVGSTTLDVDSTSIRVGIGVAAQPNTRLTIGGNETVSSDFIVINGGGVFTIGAAGVDVTALNFPLAIAGSSAAGVITGVKTSIEVVGFSGGDIDEIISFFADEITVNAGRGTVTVDKIYGFKHLVPVLTGNVTVNTAYGISLEELDIATTNWQIYSAGGQSSFAGKIRVGSNVAPISTLDITGSLAVSSNVGFYGTSPVTQNQLATGAGASVDDVITELQNLGLVRQAA